MNGMHQKPAEREVQRVQTNREELIERIARAMHADGVAQPLAGLHLARSSPQAFAHAGNYLPAPVEPCEHDTWQLVGEKQVFPVWMWMNISGRMNSGISSREHRE
jgi:hypothetical protein